MSDDWYDEIEESPEDQRRDKILGLIREALDARIMRPVTVRTLEVDFEARTVSVDGRVYGPIEQRGFAIPLLDSTYPVMPSRTAEPW